MPVNYVLVERPNPLDSALPRKYYAQAKASGSIPLKQLSKNMAARCTVTSSDILAVLDALIQEMVAELGEGRIVNLGDFGSFRLTLFGDGAGTEAQFNSGLIRGSRIVFRPGAELKQMLSALSYRKV